MVMPERPPVRRQCPRRQVGLVDQARQQPAPGLACKQWAAVPADLAGNLPVPRALPLTNPHCTSHRNFKPLRRPRTVASSSIAVATRDLTFKDSGNTMQSPIICCIK